MKSLSREKNLILGLLLGVTLAIAIPHLTPQELGATPADSDLQGLICRGDQNMNESSVFYGDISLRCN